jgi:hypothetical protein
MPSPTEPTWPTNGTGRRNLFIDAEPALHGTGSPSRPTTMSGTRRRGRGLVVALEESIGAPAGGPTCLDRAPRGIPSPLARVREQTARADRATRRLLTRRLAPPYRPLIAIVATAAQLLTVSWLGLSLRAAATERDLARSEQRTTARALKVARDQVRVLTAQRDSSVAAARAARREQARASAAHTRRTRADKAGHQTAARRANRRTRSDP